MNTYAANIDDVREARDRIAPHAHCTPVLTSNTLDELAGRRLFFKCENLQKVGAFKFRGACNAVLRLPESVASRGVVTHSSGNHAQALALAAAIRKVTAHVVMPTNAPSVKRRAVEGYGATIYPCEPTLEARETLSEEVLQRTGGTLIPPYDHPDIIAGQGTIALELLEQVENLDAIVAPIGGGGLMSGLCIAARGLNPRIRLFAAEPTGADDAARSMAAGRLIPQTSPNTVADGLLTSLGEHTWPIVRDHVEQVMTVTDDQIIAAMRLVWERMKIIIEPSAAAAVAVTLSEEFKSLADQPATADQLVGKGLSRVAVVLSGGNVDMDSLPW